MFINTSGVIPNYLNTISTPSVTASGRVNSSGPVQPALVQLNDGYLVKESVRSQTEPSKIAIYALNHFSAPDFLMQTLALEQLSFFVQSVFECNFWGSSELGGVCLTGVRILISCSPSCFENQNSAFWGRQLMLHDRCLKYYQFQGTVCRMFFQRSTISLSNFFLSYYLPHFLPSQKLKAIFWLQLSNYLWGSMNLLAICLSPNVMVLVLVSMRCKLIDVSKLYYFLCSVGRSRKWA